MSGALEPAVVHNKLSGNPHDIDSETGGASPPARTSLVNYPRGSIGFTSPLCSAFSVFDNLIPS